MTDEIIVFAYANIVLTKQIIRNILQTHTSVLAHNEVSKLYGVFLNIEDYFRFPISGIEKLVCGCYCNHQVHFDEDLYIDIGNKRIYYRNTEFHMIFARFQNLTCFNKKEHVVMDFVYDLFRYSINTIRNDNLYTNDLTVISFKRGENIDFYKVPQNIKQEIVSVVRKSFEYFPDAYAMFVLMPTATDFFKSIPIMCNCGKHLKRIHLTDELTFHELGPSESHEALLRLNTNITINNINFKDFDFYEYIPRNTHTYTNLIEKYPCFYDTKLTMLRYEFSQLRELIINNSEILEKHFK